MRWAPLVALVWLAPLAAEPWAVAVRCGLQDAAPTTWTGRLTVEPGQLLRLEGWLCGAEDQVSADGSFSLRSDALPAPGKQPARALPNGLLAQLEAGRDARLSLAVNQQTATVRLAELLPGRPQTLLGGAVEVALAPYYTTLRESADEDDFPAVCSLPNGDQVAVWQAWSEAAGRDQLWLARCRNGGWEPAQPIPAASGDLFGATVTAAGTTGWWVCWTALAGTESDLWAARATLTGEQVAWSQPVNISRAPGHDFQATAATAPNGEVWLAWRAGRGASSDILAAVCRDEQWQPPVVVDASPANEWEPALAAGPAGVWVAWDSYRHGSYDVFCRRLDGAQPGPILAVAASAAFEAKASVACGPGGEVWVAWNNGPTGWGKDTGFTIPAEQRQAAIYGQRSLGLAVLRDGRWFDPPAWPATTGDAALVEEPQIACDRSGRLWLAYRRPRNIPRDGGSKIRNERVWEVSATWLDDAGWAPPLLFPARLGRQDSWPQLAAAGPQMAVVFHTDGRQTADLRRNHQNRIFATRLSADRPAQPPALRPRPAVTPATIDEPEAAALRRLRSHRLTAGGTAYRLARGDTHRHTEISWDGVGDGSLHDAYRYAADAASLDFFLATDHNQRSGVDLEYVRWWNYKLAELMSLPERFVTLFGYERSLGFPNGHRNILQPTREKPSFKMTGDPQDLPRLYAYAKETGSLVIPHTSATNHGTNWYAYDDTVEPVVEIFQGARLCYEYEGCPKGGAPGDRQADSTGYQPEGFVWRAWQKGCRLGIISSSDHGSTHCSYAAVWTPRLDRRAILDSISARRTYGATDNVLVDVRSGDHPMGESWTQATPPQLRIDLQGTSELAEVAIIRDYQFVYTADPPGSTFQLDWQDNQFGTGTHLYYVRVQQADGNLAWSSPVWITGG
ncbi:MAG: hypothetical protein IT204_09365 [Fimbriimonadaceae bacterium]|nr:hypothetical protein [Fimbriimonadaceae bacterium]